MKRFSKAVVFFWSILIFFYLFPILVNAQSIGDDSGDPDSPIDGGLSILVAAGVGYGIKKIRDERKKSSNKLS